MHVQGMDGGIVCVSVSVLVATQVGLDGRYRFLEY